MYKGVYYCSTNLRMQPPISDVILPVLCVPVVQVYVVLVICYPEIKFVNQNMFFRSSGDTFYWQYMRKNQQRALISKAYDHCKMYIHGGPSGLKAELG